MKPLRKERPPTMTPRPLSHVAEPVARVGEAVVWQCPHCRHQFCAEYGPPRRGTPLVAWLREHVACARPALPMGEDAATERLALEALAGIDGERGH